MKFQYSIAQEMHRVRQQGRREPLGTTSEIAEKLGIPVNRLARYLNRPGAPQPVIDNRSRGVRQRVRWYKPSEVKRWVMELEGSQQ